MTDVAKKEQKPKGGRPAVGVMAQRAKDKLTELREKEKERRLEVRAKREELERLMVLAMARDRRIQIGRERKEEKQLAFVFGRMLLTALVQPDATQAVVGPAEITVLDAELRASLDRYIARQRKPNPSGDSKAGEAPASASTA